MEQLILWGLTTLVAAFVGSYLAGYLKKKGENLATHEDVDKLVTQMKAVTQATKEIESKISSEVWDRQKQWELKREILFEAAKRLSEIDNELLAFNTFWERRKTDEEVSGTSWITLEHNYVTAWQKASRSFEEAESLIQVTCSRETLIAFAELSYLMRQTAAKIAGGDLVIYSNTKAERNKKFAAARVAIRKELGIGFYLTPQSSGSSATPSPD